MRFTDGMDLWDWILAAAIFILAVLAGYWLAPPYGALGGAVIGALLIWRGKTNRDRIRAKE